MVYSKTVLVRIPDKDYEKKYGKIIEYSLDERLKKRTDEKIKKQLEKKDKDFFAIVDGAEGCILKGSKVMMANGSWKNVEDIKLGDIVLSPQEDGSYLYANVINLFKFKSNDIYDVYELNRQKRKLYSCSYNHFIPINEKNRKTKLWKTNHYSAEELYKKSNNFMKNSTTYTMFPINNFNGGGNCEIEPYSLGVWLGDGHFLSNTKYVKNKEECFRRNYYRRFRSGRIGFVSGGKVNCKLVEELKHTNRDVGITTNDLEIIEYISQYYPIMKFYSKKLTNVRTYRFSLNGKFCKYLTKYGLEGKGSGEKFIPKEALTSDIEYRKKLLAGLIDTDGTLSKSCSYSITTKSEQLAKDIEFLVYSLGGRCSIRKIKKGIKSIGFIGEYFRVSFYMGKINIPILLKRKQRENKFFYLSVNRTSIKLEKRDGDIVYGFELDSPSHWYIGDNYVVQKNSGKTTFSLQWAKYADNSFNLSRVVFTPEEFKEAIFKAKKGQAIVYDEAFTGLSSRSALSAINRYLVSLAMQIRQKNLFIILALPSVFLLDKYFVMFRAKVLIHIYENKGIRGYFRVYNPKKIKKLILEGKSTYSYSKKVRTNFKGRFYGKFGLGDELEEEYRKRKMKALEQSEQNPMTAGQVKYKEQRDILMYLFRKETKFTYKEIANILLDYGIDISYVQIRNICVKFGDLPKKDDKIEEQEELKQDRREEVIKELEKEDEYE